MSDSANFEEPFFFNNTAFRSFQKIRFDDSWQKLGEYKPQKLETYLSLTDNSKVMLEYDDGVLEFTFQKGAQISEYEGFIKYNSEKILSEKFYPNETLLKNTS